MFGKTERKNVRSRLHIQSTFSVVPGVQHAYSQAIDRRSMFPVSMSRFFTDSQASGLESNRGNKASEITKAPLSHRLQITYQTNMRWDKGV